MKIRFVILLIIATTLISSAATWKVFVGNTVDFEDKATAIAQAHISKQYPSQFDEYWVSTQRECDVWVVSFFLPEYDENGKLAPIEDSGPEVRINALNGEIISVVIPR